MAATGGGGGGGGDGAAATAGAGAMTVRSVGRSLGWLGLLGWEQV